MFLQSLNFGLLSRSLHCLLSWVAPSSILGSHSLFDFALTEGPWEPRGQCWASGTQALEQMRVYPTFPGLVHGSSHWLVLSGRT